MGSDATNPVSLQNGPLPNPRTRPARLVLLRRFYGFGTLILLLGCSEVIRGADSYSAALDRRFSNGPPAEAANPQVLALEQGLSEEVHEMSQRPEASPPPPSEVFSGIKVFLLAAVGAVGAFAVGVITVMALRRWNRWLDRRVLKPGSAESIMAEDPALVEFLRSLRESVETAPLPAGPGGAAVPKAPLASSVAGKDSPPPEPPADPFALTKHLAGLRAAFPRVGRAAGDAQRLSTLREISAHVELIKEASSQPHLRSIWLLASALNGLLKQLCSKAANVTPSALRTVATAIDTLELLCGRTVRPDLATHPPVRLLAVDDDPISRRAVSVALRKAFSDTDLGSDGHSALELAQQQPYDLIFLDVEMPGLDGFEVCKKIRQTELNRTTPVVFVTSHTDFDARAKSASLGAQDLIGKPFLAFEITVKALTLVLRARLEDRSPASVSSKAQESSSIVSAPHSAEVASAGVDAATVTPVDGRGPNARPAKATPEVVASHAAPASDPSCGIGKGLDRARPGTGSTAPSDPQLSGREFARAFFKGAPAHVKFLLNKLASIRATGRHIDRDELLGELFIGVHAICCEAGNAQLDAAVRVGSALEALLKKLVERPAVCTASALHTVTAALETIEQLCQREEDLDLTEAPARLLVVDDDPVARRAIGGALQLAFGRPDSADSGETAILLASEKAYDLILLDVIMPGMDGFAACSRLHESDLNRVTPVVFVTSRDDLDSRTQAAASGGCGFIPKPVLPCEITVLALTHIVRARLRRRAGKPRESAHRLPTRETALAG